MYKLDSDAHEALYIQLYREIKTRIINGDLPYGKRLEPTRNLSRDYHIGRNTVIKAYDMLEQEELISSKQGAYYYVCYSKKNTSSIKSNKQSKISYIVDFSDYNAKIEESTYKEWYKFISHELSNFEYNNISQYYSYRGINELINEIRLMLFNYRNIVCDEDQIIIGFGMEYTISIIKELLEDAPTIAISNVGDIKLQDLCQTNGIKYKVCDNFIDEIVTNGDQYSCYYLTPSQYLDHGEILPLKERNILIDCAKRNNAFIIENDYSFEYQLHNEEPSAFKALYENTFYISSFSKTLGSDIRINYLVIPKCFVEKAKSKFKYRSACVPFLTQYMLYRFIESGKYDHIVRKNKRKYLDKQKYLIDTFQNIFKDKISFYGFDSGASLVAHFKVELSNDRLKQLALSANIKTGYTNNAVLKRYNINNGLILNFASLSAQKVSQGAEILYNTLKPYLDY